MESCEIRALENTVLRIIFAPEREAVRKYCAASLEAL
jgi:hypothetical protein